MKVRTLFEKEREGEESRNRQKTEMNEAELYRAWLSMDQLID